MSSEKTLEEIKKHLQRGYPGFAPALESALKLAERAGQRGLPTFTGVQFGYRRSATIFSDMLEAVISELRTIQTNLQSAES